MKIRALRTFQTHVSVRALRNIHFFGFSQEGKHVFLPTPCFSSLYNVHCTCPTLSPSFSVERTTSFIHTLIFFLGVLSCCFCCFCCFLFSFFFQSSREKRKSPQLSAPCSSVPPARVIH